MPLLDILSDDIINAITENLNIADFTRAELRNFLNGRITTVTDQGEFTSALKGITQDLEAGGSLVQGEASGSIIGALEGGGVVGIGGGVISAKGLEIASSLMEIYTSTVDGERARQNLRNQLEDNFQRGVYHGAEGSPSRNVEDLIAQMERQQNRERAKAGGVVDESERKFGSDDPPLRQRPGRTPVEDVFEDIDFDEKQPLIDLEGGEGKEIEDTQGKNKPSKSKIPGVIAGGALAGGLLAGGLLKNETFRPTPIGGGRKKVDIDPPSRPNTPEIINPGNNLKKIGEDSPIGVGTLRADFQMMGTSYFNKIFDTPLMTQNSEWAEFDYVNNVDRQNAIEMSNFFGDAVRFKEPMFLPKFQQKLAPPSKLAVALKYVPMRREVQLFQPFVNKFDKADMGRNMEFTDPYNRSVFDSNFKNLELYNPI